MRYQVLAALLCAATIATVEGHAAAGDASADAKAKAQAQALLKEGSALFQKGDKAAALEKFNAAFAAFPSPKLHFNIAQAKRGLGQPVEAMASFERFLADTPNPPARAAADANRAIVELTAELGRIELTSPTPDAEVRIDGKTAGTTPLPKPVWVVPGTHAIELSAAGFQTRKTSTEVAAGATATITVTMEPVAPVTPPAPLTAATIFAEPPPPRGFLFGRSYTWIAAGAAVGLAVGAVVAGVSMQSRYDELERSCGDKSPMRTGCTASQIDSVDFRRNLANGLWAGAGVAATTAAVLFFYEGRKVAVTPSASSGSAGLTLAGRF